MYSLVKDKTDLEILRELLEVYHKAVLGMCGQLEQTCKKIDNLPELIRSIVRSELGSEREERERKIASIEYKQTAFDSNLTKLTSRIDLLETGYQKRNPYTDRSIV